MPMYAFVDWMSSGVSFFEQFVWDLEQRGVSNIDLPVLILGVDATLVHQPSASLVQAQLLNPLDTSDEEEVDEDEE